MQMCRFMGVDLSFPSCSEIACGSVKSFVKLYTTTHNTLGYFDFRRKHWMHEIMLLKDFNSPTNGSILLPHCGMVLRDSA